MLDITTRQIRTIPSPSKTHALLILDTFGSYISSRYYLFTTYIAWQHNDRYVNNSITDYTHLHYVDTIYNYTKLILTTESKIPTITDELNYIFLSGTKVMNIYLFPPEIDRYFPQNFTKHVFFPKYHTLTIFNTPHRKIRWKLLNLPFTDY